MIIFLQSCDTKGTENKNISISKIHYKPKSKIIDAL